MKTWINLIAATTLGATTTAFAGPSIVINEIDADQTSTDAEEFIELYDGGAGNTDLTGLVVVLYNGSNDSSYDAIDLDGQSTGPDGYFVIGSALVPNVDLVEFTTNGLQNGADAVALYTGSDTDFPNGTAVTATNLLDSLVYDTNDGDDAGLLAVLANPQINEGGLGDKDTDSIGRLPDGSGAFTTLDIPTPGASNGAAPPDVILSVNKSGPQFAVAGAQITYTITVENAGIMDATGVTITDTLPAGLTFVSETSPASVTLDDSVEPDIDWSTPSVAAGTSFDIELTVEINAGVFGEIVNGVDITTTSMSDNPDDNADAWSTTVSQQVDPPTGLVINEIRTGQVGADNDEYFELSGMPGQNLGGLTYLVIGDAATKGVIEEVTLLNGLFIGGTGLFLAAEDTMTLVPAPAIDLVTTLGFEDSDNVTHVLVANFFGSNGDDLDTDDDGILDSTPWTDVIDAVGLFNPTDEDIAYGAELGFEDVGPDGDFVPGHVYRCTSDGTWTIGPFDLDADDDGNPDGDDTPKLANMACATACPGNTDGDNDVDVDDLNAVILDWGTDGSANGGDITGAVPGSDPDGIVNVNDLNAVIVNWGMCP